jgi:hypothetical protein
MGVNGLPGAGPWRISEFCEAHSHNTLNAARGKGKAVRCICPRGVARLKQWRDEFTIPAVKNARNRELRRRGVVLPRIKPKLVEERVPDLSAGACGTERGRKVIELGFNVQTSRAGIAARARAKALCTAGPCPMRMSCLRYVLSQEEPAGSWGGVFGGLDPWNRRGQELAMVDGKARVIPFDIETIKKEVGA